MENKTKIQYCDIYINDFQFHAIEPRKPTPWWRAVFKAIRSNKPARAFTTQFKVERKNKEIEIPFSFPAPPEIRKQIEDAKKSGKTIRIIIPKKGIPVHFSRDLVERIEAERNKQWKKIGRFL